MKYFKTLLVLVALFTIGTVNAQTSRLTGKSYTFVMKDAVNGGEETFDQFTFEADKVVSDAFGKKGFTSSKILEKQSVNTTNFEVTLNSAAEGTRLYRGRVDGSAIDGTIIVTDKSGNQVTYAFRGMLTEDWNKAMEMKQGK
ncbi:MAG: hypothetical protein BWY67_00458 [Bacteroidetes bacterium ADurb.Bin397]|mgnify:CR=1 FL=1|jgi:hypothetical protein|nr:hypothetical protein [Bacteroidia bacterium]OQA12200.1 MAG: hypothetical protein BWY67_00458 [Bacteroidetes bacterium ADurb.Bin397]